MRIRECRIKCSFYWSLGRHGFNRRKGLLQGLFDELCELFRTSVHYSESDGKTPGNWDPGWCNVPGIHPLNVVGTGGIRPLPPFPGRRFHSSSEAELEAGKKPDVQAVFQVLGQIAPSADDDRIAVLGKMPDRPADETEHLMGFGTFRIMERGKHRMQHRVLPFFMLDIGF